MGVAVDFHQTLGIDRGVHLRCRQGGVAEQLLDGAQVAAASQEMRRERVAERMRVAVSGNPSAPRSRAIDLKATRPQPAPATALASVHDARDYVKRQAGNYFQSH